MKKSLQLAQNAGFDVDLPAFKDGTAIALKLIELVRKDEREAAMVAILDGCPNDGGNEEIILRRAWDRVRVMNTK